MGVNFRVLFEIGRGLNFLQFWAVTATRRGVAARVVSRYGGKIIIKLELRLILFFYFLGLNIFLFLFIFDEIQIILIIG